MDQYNYQNTSMISPGHKSELVQFITFISFGVYCYLMFNNYMNSGNIWWPIGFGTICVIISTLNIFVSHYYNTGNKLENYILCIAIILIGIALWGSISYIRKQKEDVSKDEVSKDEVSKDVSILEKKYLIAVIVFIGIGILTVSPIADWVSGSVQGALYSKTFIFMFCILCFTTYIIVDFIRNYDLFGLKIDLFGTEDKKENDEGIGTIIITGLWMFYSLIVFEGIQIINRNIVSDARHYVTIAIMTLLWVILAFVNFIKTNKECKDWSKSEYRNDYKEILINILSFTTLLFVLTILYRI
jgi:uncharacterized membrane protein YqjE